MKSNSKIISETKKQVTYNRLSCAEVLCAMDCLMHHLSDRDKDKQELADWMYLGIADNDKWKLMRTDKTRKNFYYKLSKDMSTTKFESLVMLFASFVKDKCFNTKYNPGAFL